MYRSNAQGQDISAAYIQRCAQSWRVSGFAPTTINAESEDIAGLADQLDVRSLNIARDAAATYGKPVLFISDFINAITRATDGVFAITNADCMLEVCENDLALIKGLKRGECIVAKRVDVTDPEARQGDVFQFGYDFFAAHAQDLQDFVCDDMALGIPWWDHFLPLWLKARGVQAIEPEKDFVFHLLHDERWNHEVWLDLGERFDTLLTQSLVGAQIDGASVRPKIIKRILELPPTVRIELALKRLSGAHGEQLMKLRLKKRSARNISEIDAWRLVNRAGFAGGAHS
jgi:hypothetical protein